MIYASNAFLRMPQLSRIKMNDVPLPNSYHDLPPLERGGVEARKGFEFQDHIAAGMLIEMLADDELLEVWCETHDDITLVWDGASAQEFEFVQVKALTLGQLWSVAKLTERKRKNKCSVKGTSILERLLANDRGAEPSQFRIVTTLPPNEGLSFLQLRNDSPDRESALADLADLVAIGPAINFYRRAICQYTACHSGLRAIFTDGGSASE